MTQGICVWKYKFPPPLWTGTWKTQCGEEYVGMHDDPIKRRFKFCPFCGREMVRVGGGTYDRDRKFIPEESKFVPPDTKTEHIEDAIPVLRTAKEEIERLHAELETKTKLCDASIKYLKAENDALAHDYKLSLEQYDQFLKKKLVCRHCTHSFVAVNAVQVNGYVYCSEECALPYIKRLL